MGQPRRMFDYVEKLKEFIRFPSVSTDPKFKEGMAGAQGFVSGLLGSLGFKVEVVKTDVHPIVLASRGGDPSWPHIVIYGHYDVQPADPLSLWKTKPFEPTVIGNRIYGRGAADNKGPLMTNIAAVAQLLEENPKLPLRITFLIEGEEEIGSPSFPAFLAAYGARLAEGRPGLPLGHGAPEREAGGDHVRPEGPRPLRPRGHGAEGRPALGASRRRASQPDPGACRDMRDAPHPRREGQRARLLRRRARRRALGAGGAGEARGDGKAYMDFLGIDAFYTPPGFSPFEAIRFQPTLEFNGIGGGYQGEGTKTVIPSQAFAKISCRLVPNQEPDRIKALVMDAIRARTPKGVRVEFVDQHKGDAYVVVPPGRPNTPKDQSPVLARAFRAREAAVTAVWGRPPLYLREGGSVPIIPQIKKPRGWTRSCSGSSCPRTTFTRPTRASISTS